MEGVEGKMNGGEGVDKTRKLKSKMKPARYLDRFVMETYWAVYTVQPIVNVRMSLFDVRMSLFEI